MYSEQRYFHRRRWKRSNYIMNLYFLMNSAESLNLTNLRKWNSHVYRSGSLGTVVQARTVPVNRCFTRTHALHTDTVVHARNALHTHTLLYARRLTVIHASTVPATRCGARTYFTTFTYCTTRTYFTTFTYCTTGTYSAYNSVCYTQILYYMHVLYYKQVLCLKLRVLHARIALRACRTTTGRS